MACLFDRFRESATIGVLQKRPMLTPGVANFASCTATARSQLATSWQPAAVAVAWTRAITGLGQRTMDSINATQPSISATWKSEEGLARISFRS